MGAGFGRRRARRAAAVFVIAALAVLSGCSFISDTTSTVNSLRAKQQIDGALASLSKQLLAIPGISGATSTVEIQPNYRYVVSMHVTSLAVTEVQATRFAKAVTATFGAPDFGGLPQYVDLRVGQSPVVGLSAFGMSGAAIDSEFAYWAALQRAYGHPLAIGLESIGDGATGTAYGRSIAAIGPDPVSDWSALRAIPAPASDSASWTFPGVDAEGALPEESVTNLLSSLAKIVQLDAFAGETKVPLLQLAWMNSPRSVQFGVVRALDEAGTVFTRTPSWKKFVAVVRKILASKIANVTINYSDVRSGIYPATHTSKCAGATQSNEADTAALRALISAGIRFPTGAGAGFCVHA